MARSGLLLGAVALAASLLAPALRARRPDPRLDQGLHQTLGGCLGVPPRRTIQARPSNYLELIPTLKPGDRLRLAPGVYRRQIPVRNLNGAPGRCIVIEGPAQGKPARILNSDVRNTISLRNVSYVVFRNLQLAGLGLDGDGVKAEADSRYAHHVTLENLELEGYFGGEPNRCGLSTKSPAWNWVVRRVRITGAGVGMYFGRADGTSGFANSLIEHNVVANSVLYDLQIKHQLGRDTAIGMPARGTTVIRHNVFTKEAGAATGRAARPNVLVGHWPRSGPGSEDLYQIYGNVFYLNPTEALFQGEGNIALHDNLFVQRTFPWTIRIQRHNDVPKRIEVFHNTIVAPEEGIRIAGADRAYRQRVRGNAVFARIPITGGEQEGNWTAEPAAAVQTLKNPAGSPAQRTLDLSPKPGKLRGAPFDTGGLPGLLDWNRDFDGRPRLPGVRGAYGGTEARSAWAPSLTFKP